MAARCRRLRRAAAAATAGLLLAACGVPTGGSANQAADTALDTAADAAVAPTGTVPGSIAPRTTGPMETVAQPASCRSDGTPAVVAAMPPDPAPMDITLVPHPKPEVGVYKAGPPVTLCWGDAASMLGGLAACSLRTPGCDVRERWMPGVLATGAAPVTLSVGDLDSLVSIRVESATTGAVAVDLVDQPGNPTFTAPSDPGDYLVGIDLVGRARTVSYVLFARVTAGAAPSYGATAVTFPVNVAAPLPGGGLSTVAVPALPPALPSPTGPVGPTTTAG